MSDKHASVGEADTVLSLGPRPGYLPDGYTIGGKYAVKKLLGEGANGAVYEGEHSEIGHRVAIKVVHAALSAREDIIARFRREARICGTIRNRHVGQVYDVGQLPDGSPYMVMELHEGRSLGKLMADEGPLPIHVIVDFGRQLLLGLQAAHDTGAIHRDVKPDNIMIVRESSGHSIVKLVDFGIGKQVTADISARNVTQEGMVVGSPDYMPPEQLRGGPVDHRVDLYAAGVVLYEAVTGRVPFDAESLTELFVAILRDPIKPPTAARSECPPEFENVILRALERDADKRFQSASEMEKALAKVPGASVVSSAQLRRYSEPPPPTRTPELRRSQVTKGYALETERVRTAELQIPGRRKGRGVVLMALGAIALGAVLVLALRPTPQPSAPPVSGAEPRAAASAPSIGAPAPEIAAQPQPLQAAPEPSAPIVAEPTEAPAVVEPKGSVPLRRSQRAARTPVERPKQPAEPPPAGTLRTATAPAGLPAPALVQEAAAAFVRGQMPRARALYREATEKAPADAAAWRGLGMVSSRMGQREEAARAFKNYLALRPGAPDAAAIKQKLDEL